MRELRAGLGGRHSANERIVFHFTSLESFKSITASGSLGLAMSPVGQHGEGQSYARGISFDPC